MGSLRNPRVPLFAARLRSDGYDVFDDWYAAGPDADDRWRDYERQRGHTFEQALAGKAARHVYQFDLSNMILSDAAILLTPAGKSGHLELGWFLGWGRPGFILLGEEPERFDIMYQFATGVYSDYNDLLKGLDAHR